MAQGPPVPHLLLDPKVNGVGAGWHRAKNMRTVSPGTNGQPRVQQKATTAQEFPGRVASSPRTDHKLQEPAEPQMPWGGPLCPGTPGRSAGRIREKGRQMIKLLFTPEAGRELGFELAKNIGHLETGLSQTQQRLPTRGQKGSVPGQEAPHLLARLLPWSLDHVVRPPTEQRATNNH